MKLSIIIPSYNEEGNIDRVITRLKETTLPESVEREIIIVDDGSTDETPRVLEKYKDDQAIKAIILKENHGKGFALRRGIEAATGGIIILQDADLEYDPNDFSPMIAPILEGRAKAVTGSRFLGRARNMSFLHTIGNKFLSFSNNILYGKHINDLCSCYKAFETETLRSLNLDCVGFESEADMISRAERKGIEIVEIPIKYDARTSAQGKKLKWFHGLLIFLRLLRNRFINIK